MVCVRGAGLFGVDQYPAETLATCPSMGGVRAFGAGLLDDFEKAQ